MLLKENNFDPGAVAPVPTHGAGGLGFVDGRPYCQCVPKSNHLLVKKTKAVGGSRGDYRST
jgi:hypothetical protein